MPDAPFTSKVVSLNQAANVPLVPAGVPVYSITVFSIPSGITLVVTDGTGANSFPLYFATQTVEFCPPVLAGLTLIVPAGLAGSVQLGINAKQGGTPPAGQSPASYVGGAVWVSAGNGAGQGSVVQLQNPNGSGKMISLRANGATQSTGAIGALYKINTIRAANPASSFITPTSPTMPGSVAAFKGGNAIAFAGGVTPAGYDQHLGGSNTRASLTLVPQPILIPPGWGAEVAGSLGVNGEDILLVAAWDET